MAETSYIIQNGKRLNLKDAAARSSIGSCDELKTGVKHCLVHAINELAEKLDDGFVVNKDYDDDSTGIRVNNADVIVINGGVAVGDLFSNSSALNSTNLYIDAEGNKVTLSPTEGLVFEDCFGNKKSIGGIGYITEPDPNAVMFSEMEEYVEEAISASDLCVNMVYTEDEESIIPGAITVKADKTFEEVVKAYNDGKTVYAKCTLEDASTYTVPLVAADDVEAIFLLNAGSGALMIVMGAELGNYAVVGFSDLANDLGLTDHLNSRNNPHHVTAAQVGAPTVAEMNAAIKSVKVETDGHTIIYDKDGKLSVNTADAVGDNTLPITAAAVNTTVGNIEVLLKTI